MVFSLVFIPVASAFAGGAPPRQLFVSVIQNPPVLSSLNAIDSLVDFARDSGIKIMFVQLYRANRAWFPSSLADSSPYFECRARTGGDPLSLLIERAHRAGIEVHGWFNLMSLSSNGDAFILKKYGPGILTRNLKKKRSIGDYKIDSQYFLEPGDPRVREELAAIVEEALLLYPALDGVQFDYIRYPDRNPFYGYTETNIERFKKATGKTPAEGDVTWKDWKRRQVTELLEMLVARTRRLRPGIQISITACVPYVRAFEEAFQDWPSWLNRRLVDFVTLMTYSSDPREFEKDILEAKSKVADFDSVNIAVGAYKFLDSPFKFGKELSICDSQSGKGCVILHYGSLLEAPALKKLLRIPIK